MDLRPEAQFGTVRTKLCGQPIPKISMGFRCCCLEIEGVILTGFCAVAGKMQFAVFAPNGIVDEEGTVVGHIPNGFQNGFGLGAQCVIAIELACGAEHSGIEHIGGEVYILDEFVCHGPFNKNPAIQFFQQAKLVEILTEEVDQFVNPFLGQIRKAFIAAALYIVSKLDHIPHSPVRDVVSVCMIGWVTHWKHSLGEEFEAFRQEKVFKE